MSKSESERAVDTGLAGWLPDSVVNSLGNPAMLRALFEGHPEMVLVAGADGRIAGANCRTLVEFGYFRRDLEGQPIEMLLSTAARERYARHLRRYMLRSPDCAQGSFLNIKARDSRGNEFPVDVTLKPFATESGTYVMVVCRRFDPFRAGSRAHISALLENSRDYAINELDAQGRILTWNEGSRRVYNRTAAEALGQNYSILFTPAEIAAGEPARQLQEASRSSMAVHSAGWRTGADGEEIWAEVELAAARNISGLFNGFTRVLHDLTCHKRAEEHLRETNRIQGESAAELERRVAERTLQLEATVEELRRKNEEIATFAGVVSHDLKEKEVLLREVYHRVKNNMQVVQSLLKLRARSLSDGDARNAIETSVERVHVMAMVHERLYRMPDLARLSLVAYLRDVARGAIASHSERPDQVELEMDAAEIPLTLDIAVPFGLLANELISNCLKHGLPHGRPGKIHLSVACIPGAVRFVVEDNGVGLPDDFDAARTTSMGLKLAASLAHQLGGSLEFSSSNGCRIQGDFTRLGKHAENGNCADGAPGLDAA
ncbi:MAG: PAS domain S-box protein [Terracidiphilus sp.]|jgi:PAS domain S-box-containing protein